MERFIRLNRSILDCDLAKGGWRLDEEGIAAIEDEVAELVGSGVWLRGSRIRTCLTAGNAA